MKALLKLYRQLPLLALGVALGSAPVLAQSYPGLSAPTRSNDSSVETQRPTTGYGGLTRGATTRKAPVRSRIGGEEEQPQETQAGSQPSETQNTVQNAPSSNFEMPSQSSSGRQEQIPPVRTEEDMQTAAIIQQNAILRPSAQPGPRLNEKTLALLNKPQVKENGMWPAEARTVSYIKAVFVDIQNTPVNKRREKISNIRTQIENMMDANLRKIATPDEVSLKMGLSQAAVDQNKAAAKATNIRLKQALNKLR